MQLMRSSERERGEKFEEQKALYEVLHRGDESKDSFKNRRRIVNGLHII